MSANKSSTLILLKDCLLRPLNDSIKLSRPLFENPLNLEIKSNERWAVIGPRKTDLLSVLAAQHVPNPSLSRKYPFLNKSVWPSQVIQLVEFKGSIPVTHLSARYEHFRDEFDFSLYKYLGQSLGVSNGANHSEIINVMKQLKLNEFADRWVVGLSNGQMRRARLARALLKKPRLLLIDEPYLGLDPSARENLSDILEMLPHELNVILGLRYQDKFPSWITHVAVTDAKGIVDQGPIENVRHLIEKLQTEERRKLQDTLRKHTSRKHNTSNDIILELDKISVAYNGQPVIQNLKWQVRRGERWHLRGDNGTGKSTLLSLITADHPQSWNSKIIINGTPRKTGRQNYFSINEMIGHTSPEIHNLFPTDLSTFDVVSTGYIVGSVIPPREKLSEEQRASVLKHLEEFGIDPEKTLYDLNLSDQKTVLFLRSIIKNPDILILDEAFSAMDSWRVEQCKAFLSEWEGTIITVGHIEEELPLCDKYIRLHMNQDSEQGAVVHKIET